jgi:arabinose-5-phosphate isomerase
MDFTQQARRIVELEIAELARLLDRIDGRFSEAVEALMECLKEKRKIVVCGVGKSGNIGRKFTATLNSTGATSVNLNAQDALHGDLGVLDEGDVVVLLSYSGETQELLDLLPHLRRMDVRLIAISGDASSTLARNSDIVLDVSVQREACPLNLAPTTSTTVMLVLCDAMAMVLMEARGIQAEDFAKFHPSGALGKALTKVSDVMRTGEAMACVAPETSVRNALETMTKAHSGAALVVNADGRLAGVFTHGDFVRAFQHDAAIGDRCVRDFMTGDPVTIGPDRLATEVLALLEHHRVDDLPVVNDVGCPVGLVDTQDLTRVKWI